MLNRISSLGLLLTVAWLSAFTPWRAAAQSQFKVYRNEPESQAASRMLYEYLSRIAWKYLDERHRDVAAISTPDQVLSRKRLIRERMLEMLGPLPERTPLKPLVTGRLSREGYTVEKVLFQSQPRFYVTANFYLPTVGQKPFPAVLGACGHSLPSKAEGFYQDVWISLARLGIAVLSFDPPGQGERLMYYQEDLGETLLQGTTTEHSMAGIQCLLTGSNAATYFIWDMLRSVDYLLSRPEIDPQRIAVTGNSGGGTQSAYLAALDDRIAVAVPSCYLTAWRRLWETIGPQDAEQNMLPFIGSGLDFGDYIIPFAPRPYLMNTAIQDFFSILGARETYAEAKRIYDILGAGDKIAQFEADDEHGYTLPRREACYGWMAKYLLGLEGPRKEEPLSLESERNLRVTPTGQVSTSYPDAQTIGSLNAAFARKIAPALPAPASVAAFESFRDEICSRARRLTAFENVNTPLNIQNRGYGKIPGATVEFLTFESEPGITLPALLFRPDSLKPGLPAVLYAADRDKAEDVQADIATLAAGGRLVLAPDVRGQGETARATSKNTLFDEWFSADWDIALMALQVKKTLVGMRALDLIRAVDALNALGGGHTERIVALGKGSASVPLLHAAALDSRIAGVCLENGLVSWKAVAKAKYHRRQLDNVVRGVLAAYDLPELAATLAPRTLILSNTADPLGHVLSVEEVTAAYKETVDCYNIFGRRENLVIAERPQGISPAQAYGHMLDR